MIKFFSILLFVSAALAASVPGNEGGLIPDKLAVQYTAGANIKITKTEILSLFKQINDWTMGKTDGVSDTASMNIQYTGSGIFKTKKAPKLFSFEESELVRVLQNLEEKQESFDGESIAISFHWELFSNWNSIKFQKIKKESRKEHWTVFYFPCKISFSFQRLEKNGRQLVKMTLNSVYWQLNDTHNVWIAVNVCKACDQLKNLFNTWKKANEFTIFGQTF